jgi:hypothetical protein
MERATEKQLGALHGTVAAALAQEISQAVEPKERIAAINAAVKFLKDNGITAVPDNDSIRNLRHQAANAVTAKELEELFNAS